jgi:uncharacterized protein
VRPFSLLVKPASADCNLACDYCFYLEKQGLYADTARHRMSRDTLETLIRSYMRTQQPVYAFGWQGGEPTLMGEQFFEDIITLQRRHAPQGSTVSNGLQTNGTLLTDSFAKLLGRYDYLVGISIDGPAEIHDRYRRTRSDRGSHAEVMRGYELLRHHGVAFNVLTLVSQANVHRPRETYRYLRELGMDYHQYIPCVEFDEEGRLLPYSITGEQWGSFLNEVFDEWAGRDVGTVSVRHFDAVLTKLLDNVASTCVMGKDCRKYFVVEYNGDVYPCDFFVDADKRLGNVAEDDFLTLWRSPKYRAFGLQKKHWNPACAECPYLDFCAGDCLKHRFRGEEDPEQLSVLCSGWQSFYRRNLEELRQVASAIRRARAEGQQSFSYARQDQPQR